MHANSKKHTHTRKQKGRDGEAGGVKWTKRLTCVVRLWLVVVLCGRDEAGGWNKNSVEKLGQDTDPKDDNKPGVWHENVAVRASAGSGEGRALTAGPPGEGQRED